MTNRTVAFLDVLGFRQLIESKSADDIGGSFVKVVGHSVPAMNRKFPVEGSGHPTFFPDWDAERPWCINHSFSDSIILISNDESEEASLALLIYALRVTQIMMGSKYPVRGAIAHGEMFVDEKQSMFLGKALTQAYELENKQNWAGVLIDDSVEDAFPGILTGEHPVQGLRNALFPRYQVPMKAGNVREYYTLNWRWNLIVAEGTKSLFDDGGNWAAKVKIDEALKYAQAMRQSGRAYVKDQNVLPLEVRSFIFDAGPPKDKMPPHGDDY